MRINAMKTTIQITPTAAAVKPLPSALPDEPTIKSRLEYLRGEIRAERISYGELAELQSLATHIAPNDAELREAAGLPEFPNNKPVAPQYTIGQDAGMRTWNVSDQFCVLLAGFTARRDAEAALSLLRQLYRERMKVQKWAAENAKLRAALADIVALDDETIDAERGRYAAGKRYYSFRRIARAALNLTTTQRL